MASLRQKLRSCAPAAFLPVSPLMIAWYFFVMFLVTLEFIFVIVLICFKDPTSEFIVTNINRPLLFILCICDIVISLNTSFIDKGTIIEDRALARRKYLRSGYAVLDVLALLAVICETVLNRDFEVQFPFLNLLLLVKIFKVKEFDSLIMKYIIRSSEKLVLYEVAKHFLLIVLVCHLIGSFFFYLDLKLLAAQWYPLQQLWIFNSYAYEDIYSLGTFQRYTYAFYYAVVTLSGTAYGDLTPLNQTETAYTFLSLIIPMIVYSYLFSVVFRALGDRRRRNQQEIKYKKIAWKYFQDVGLQDQEINKFVNYLGYAHSRKMHANNEYAEKMAPSVRVAYMKDAIDNNYDFSIFEQVLSGSAREMEKIKQIIYRIAEEETCPISTVISLQSPKRQKLYYLVSGQVSEYVQLHRQKYGKKIEDRSFIGQYVFFSGVVPSRASHLYETAEFSLFQTIDREKFIRQIRKERTLVETFGGLKMQLIEGTEKMMNLGCFFCQETTHVLYRCDKLRVVVDAVEVYNREQGRTKINRLFNNNHGRYNQIKKQIQSYCDMQNKSSEQYTRNQAKLTQTEAGFSKYTPRTKPRAFESVQAWRQFHPAYNI